MESKLNASEESRETLFIIYSYFSHILNSSQSLSIPPFSRFTPLLFPFQKSGEQDSSQGSQLNMAQCITSYGETRHKASYHFTQGSPVGGKQAQVQAKG